MPYIWLRYTDISGTQSSRRFNALREIHAPTTTRQRETSLRNYRVNHLLGAWTNYDIQISADELAKPAAKAFTDAFWIGAAQWISLSTSTTEPADNTFIALDIPDGDIPYTYVAGSKRLPELAFIATSKEPI